MATREKTIQFTFDTLTTTVVDATVTNYTQITLYIPETIIAFTSVSVDVGWMDIATSAGTITETRCGLRLAAVAYSTVTETGNLTSTGENQAGLFSPFDFTSYFTTNWTGTSMTCDVQVYFDQSSGATLGMNNVTSTIAITYTYNDDTGTNATQIKTVMIPLESLVTTLTTTPDSEIGTNQIPILTGGSGILVEDTPVIRDYAFIIGDCDNSAGAGATDWTISTNIDGGSSFSFGAIEMALQTNRYFRGIWRPAAPDTTLVHAFQMWIDAGTRGNHLPIVLQITYEFDASSTTSVLNSIQLNLPIDSFLGYTAATEQSTSELDFFIEEPTTITLRQSGVCVYWTQPSNPTLISVAAGSQVARTYTPRGTAESSIHGLMQRIDSGGAQGAGISIARGKNTITVDSFTTGAVRASGASMVLYLNYESGLDAGGIGAHNHTVIKNVTQWSNATVVSNTESDYSFSIPETNYYINRCALKLHNIAQQISGTEVGIQVLAGEFKASGYFNSLGIMSSDPERGYTFFLLDLTNVFLQFTGDARKDRVDIETARDIKIGNSNTSAIGSQIIATYHSITSTVSGTLTGFTGTVTLGMHDTTNHVKLLETSRSGDGVFTFTWFDDVENVYVVALAATTGKGRSSDDVGV